MPSYKVTVEVEVWVNAEHAEEAATRADEGVYKALDATWLEQYVEATRAAKVEQLERGKKTYKVVFAGRVVHTVVVDAETDEEAKKLAEGHFRDNTDYQYEWDGQDDQNPRVEVVGP